MFSLDAQQSALSFVIAQNTHIETGVYQLQYPEIQYPALIPVDTTANPFAKTITYFSSNKFGQAKWINGNSDDIPIAGNTRDKFETQVHTAGIGYGWGWEEVNQAQLLGISLQDDDARAARRAYEEKVDAVALLGDTEKGFAGGLFNAPSVTATNAAFGNWATQTPDNILADINQALTGVFTGTNTTAVADTLILPWSKWLTISTRRLTSSDKTILSFIYEHNVYTALTGRPLLIRGSRLLDTAGVGGTARMIAYLRDPSVLKLHIPMPLRFLGVYQESPLRWLVPGVFRLGGLDIRQPKAIVYIDGI